GDGDQRRTQHVQQDDGDRQAGEVLDVADDALRQLDDQEVAGRPADPAGRVGRVERDEQGDGQPDQQEDDIGVQLADQLRVEPDAARLRVAAVGPAPGDHGADGQHGSGDNGDAGDQQRDRPADDELPDTGLGRPKPQGRGDGHDDHREQEVPGDD